jgi:hypothetical protein
VQILAAQPGGALPPDHRGSTFFVNCVTIQPTVFSIA